MKVRVVCLLVFCFIGLALSAPKMLTPQEKWKKGGSYIAQARDTVDRYLLKDFPLWGQTWMFGKGDNERAYNSFGKSLPTHLVKVTFPGAAGGGDFDIRYAILTGKNYRSTANLINEVTAQFDRNKVTIPYKVWRDSLLAGADTLISLARRKAPDTLFSCDSNFFERQRTNPGKYTRFRTILSYPDAVVDPSYRWQDDDKVDTMTWGGYNARDRWQWFRERPVAWGETPFNETQRFIYNQKADWEAMGYSRAAVPPATYYRPMNLMTADFSQPIDYCDSLANKCYEYVRCTGIKRPDQNFWQVHLFPVVKWFPRQQLTGSAGIPLLTDSLAMGMWEARAMRKMSLAHINEPYLFTYQIRRDSIKTQTSTGKDTVIYPNVHDRFTIHDTSGFKNVYLKDSSKYTIRLISYRKPYYSDSASCVISVQFLDGGITPLTDTIKTSINNESDAGFDEFHLFRRPGRIVRLAYDSYPEVGRAILRMYAESGRDDKVYSDMYTRCTGEWLVTDAKIGSEYRYPPRLAPLPEGVTWRLPFADHGGTADQLIMDTNYTESRYVYNNCPVLPIPALEGYTASDLRGIVYRMPPTCDAPAMANALYILIQAINHVTHPIDRRQLFKRITMLGPMLEQRENLNKKLTPRQIATATAFCVETWENDFPRYRTTYDNEMKQWVNQINRYANASDAELMRFGRVTLR